MRILDRYVMREFFKIFVLFSLAAPILFIMGDWTDNLDTFTERGITAPRVALGYLFQMPEFILYSFPIAALIATVFTVSNMTRHSEMAAAKAGGISFYGALRMLPVVGIVLTLVGLGLSELVPITESKRRDIMGRTETSYSQSEKVYVSEEGDAYAVQRIDTEGGGMIRTLNVERPAEPGVAPAIHIVADDAVYDTAVSTWRLRNGYYRVLLDDTTDRVVAFAELRSPAFQVTPDEMAARPKDPEEMRFLELGRHIRTLERSGLEPRELMVERLQKIAIPVAALIIILFGAPLANTSSRGGPAYGIGISLGITIVYLMMFKVTEAAGSTGAMPIWAAAWLPNAVFLAAGGVLLWRVRT